MNLTRRQCMTIALIFGDMQTAIEWIEYVEETHTLRSIITLLDSGDYIEPNARLAFNLIVIGEL